MCIDPLSPRCDRFYAALATTELPIISTLGANWRYWAANQDFGNPLQLRRAMDHGVRVVLAHCVPDGTDVDTDQGSNGPRVRSFDLFARMMD